VVGCKALHRPAGKGVADFHFRALRAIPFEGEVLDLVLGEDYLDRVVGGGDLQPPLVVLLDPFAHVGAQDVACNAERFL